MLGWIAFGLALTARSGIIDVMRQGRTALQSAAFNWQGVVHESELFPEQVLELLCATSSSGYTKFCVSICFFV